MPLAGKHAHPVINEARTKKAREVYDLFVREVGPLKAHEMLSELWSIVGNVAFLDQMHKILFESVTIAKTKLKP